MLPPPNPIGGVGFNNQFPFHHHNRRNNNSFRGRNRNFNGKRGGGKSNNETRREVIKSDSNSSRQPNNGNKPANSNSNANSSSSVSSSSSGKEIASGSGAGGGWKEKLSGWSTAASSWSAKTLEGSSNSLSKALTDFNKQFKPQMEVAVDFVGPTWDRAVEIAKPVTGPLREVWLGLSPQTRAFVKPAATGTAVAHIVLGFPSRR